MTGKQKIETLTHAWYGYALFTGVATLVQNGIGFFSIVGAAVSTLFSFAVTWFLGGRLLARSHVWRTILIGLSGIFAVLGTLASAKLGWLFIHDWSLATLVLTGLTVTNVGMNLKSIRVLTDASVKSYFG